MLYTPLLPEAASGTLEPRHCVVPVRVMARHAELVLGEAARLDKTNRVVHVSSETGELAVGYERLVLALGAVSRVLPVPGLDLHAHFFKSLEDAIRLRNHVLRRLELAATGDAERQLAFVFVGAGYAGVEALAELSDLVRDALRWYPSLRHVRHRWLLVDAAPKILPEIPARLGDYAARELAQRGVELRTSTTLASVDEHEAVLSDGERIPTATLVWTAGVTPVPALADWDLPLDDR